MKRLDLGRTSLLLVSSLLLATSWIAPSRGSSVGTWSISEEKKISISGVSAYVEKISATADRVWRSDGMPSPGAPIPSVADCDSNGNCTPVSLRSQFGNDVTIVTLRDGSRRAYFVSMSTSGKVIVSAKMTADGLGHEATINTPITASMQQKAWGVPDAVLLPDGRVRIYYVDKSEQGRCPEIIKSATSSDATGTTFTLDEGTRLTGGWVDTHMMRAEAGNWLLLTSTGPGCAPQRLALFSSTDGLTFTQLGSFLSSSDYNRLDPYTYKIDENTYKLYFTASGLGKELSGPYELRSALLTYTAPAPAPSPSPTPTPTISPTPTPTPTVATSVTPTSTPSAEASPSPSMATTSTPVSAVKKSITCVKGKTTKKVTGVAPKCPKGFKKKA